ncbi:MAG: 1-acyl-sn-glycerol-3-phosphate acyltransferase [Thermoflexia bacterium]|nr:MAG: 1-acyl-sn-glycerol-3-phosphate acyltransferase [Thermoflexia bacterium]
MKAEIRRALKGLARYLVRVLVRVEAVGLERIPPSGPLLLINNHINFLDPVLSYLLAPRHLVGFSKFENFAHPLLGPLVRFGDAIPVRRGTADLPAIRAALDALERGEVLLIDPEGTRSHHGRLQPARTGVVLLALRSSAPILPVAIWGQERFWENLRRLRRTRVWMRVGYPFHLRADGERASREEREAMTREVMWQLAALLPAPYRGAYADLDRATERYLRFPPGSRSNLEEMTE